MTASRAAAGGCVTFGLPRPPAVAPDGRSVHVLRIPDASVGEMHRMLVWVDADRDGVFDRGGPYADFESDFESRTVNGNGQRVHAVPRQFEASLVTPFSDRISRAGRYTSLRLKLTARTDEVIMRTASSIGGCE